jgi:hypothetical protein
MFVKRSLFAFFFIFVIRVSAQSDVPVISGGAGFVSTRAFGSDFFSPQIAPVVLVPVGDKWLVEARGTIGEIIFQQNGNSGPWHSSTFTSVDFLQVDYIANSHLTITAGYFLTPFGIYNERLSPIWIKNFQDPPIIGAIGTQTSGSSTGGMLRGVALARESWELSYVAYFSAASTVNKFNSGRAAGGRAGVFFPHTRLEVGVSYQRFLQDTHANSSGVYLSWLPTQLPLDIKAEYAHSPSGQGYWLEGAYRLSHYGGENSLIGRAQLLGRVQQFYKGTVSPTSGLPSVDTQRVDFGMNYYLPHNIHLNGSYGREFSDQGNGNVWEAGLIYRFLSPMPFWPKGDK